MERTCSINGCDEPFLARDWCTKHYQRWRATGSATGTLGYVPNRHETRSATVGVLIITRTDGSEVRALYDLTDHGIVTARTWHWSRGYVACNVLGGRSGPRGLVLLHRELLGIDRFDPRRVDHISGDRLDDRRVNLRIADAGLNGENRAVVNELGTSKYRGVCWDKSRNLWKAYTRIAGRMHNVGYYPTEDQAADAIAVYRAEHGVNTGYPRRHAGTPSKSKR